MLTNKKRNLIQNNFEIKPFELEKGSPLTQINHIGSPKVIIEEDEVDQAKLNLGYRFPTYYGKQNYYAFVVFNMMFGGDPLQYCSMKFVKSKV